MQKKYLLNRFVCLAITLSTLAASPARAYDALSGNWRGGYIGAFMGVASADFRSDPGILGPSGTDSSFTGGGDLGVNVETGKLVFGIEADASSLFNSSKSNEIKYQENWMATVRGRAGIDINRFLPYITAGLAATNVRAENPDGRAHENLDSSYVVGGGLDASLSSRWIGRVEYLYVDVPKVSSTIGNETTTGGSGNNIVRVGLNYRF